MNRCIQIPTLRRDIDIQKSLSWGEVIWGGITPITV
jgi:hypothetical protein